MALPPSTIMLQSWALIRRYAIMIYRTPIKSFIRMLIWPAIVIGLIVYMMHGMLADKEARDYAEMAQYIPVASLITTGFHVYHFSEWLVSDKSTGIKSLMLSMGLKRSSYYLGNSICFIGFIMPLIMVTAIVSLIYILSDSQSTTVAILLVFIMLVIHLTGFIFAFSSIINSNGLAAIIFVYIIAENFLHDLIIRIMESTDQFWWPFLLFAASISPYESLRIFSDSYIICKNCNETKLELSSISQVKRVAQPTYLILLALTFWSLLAFAFARWFEEVCPWQKDSMVRKPFFCLETNQTLEHDDSSIENDSRGDSEYFERILSSREVGISIRKLSKQFKKVPAVDNVNFNVYKGETTLLLGHNGAGKTTLMNMILGKLMPDGGNVMIRQASSELTQEAACGICPQDSILDDNLTVKEQLELFYTIKASGLSSEERNSHISTTINDVGLTDHSHKQARDLSGGMKRKLALGMAFIGQSNILILDEPSSGLDPDSRMSIWNAIRRYRAERTVLLSTQHMEEADYLGDRIAIMSAGRIVCCGSSTFLNNLFGSGYKLRVECFASKTNELLAFIRKYFLYAKVSEDSQIASPSNSTTSTDPIQDIVIELVGDKSEDSERNLILMLEEIERDGERLHVKSHGLKSSSIEDVMLNTGKILSSETTNGSVKLSVTSTKGHIATMASLTRRTNLNSFATQRLFFYAFITKHFHTFRRDWATILFYRVLVVSFRAWMLIRGMRTTMQYLSYNTELMNTLMVFHLVYYPTSERVSKLKTIQLTSNANFVVYWIAQLAADFLWILVLPLAVRVFMALSFSGEFLVEKTIVHQLIALAAILFGLSAALLAYVISNILTNGRTSMGFFIMIFSLSFIEYIIYGLLTLSFSYDFRSLHQFAQKVFIAILPTDAFQYIVSGFSLKCYIKWPQYDHCDPVEGFSPVAFGFMALGGQIVSYAIILYLIERANADLSWYLRYQNLFSCFAKAHRSEQREIDKDVVDESTKAIRIIKDIPRNRFSLVVANINKSYIKGKKVIDHLSFTVNKGECFGLLGVNGAGKSTTFSMISAEAKPDRGRIWMNGQYNNGDIDKYRNQLGYDPQSNPATSLSPTEALFLMARLRRVDEQSIPILVDSVLELLDMSQHGLKNSKNLSGGTKRKLALGMSLIGNPALLALDEPTAGVDPIARRGIWQLLRSLRMQNGASIVISSHAMEECEAICDRIAIMARGRLRCIGTFLHLRNKFAKGCSIRVQFSLGEGSASATPTTVLISELDSRLKREIGNAVQLVDQNVNSATFDVTDNNVKRSSLFKILRDFRQKHANISYMLNDASLEDIFLKLAREQQQLEQQQQNHQRQPQQHALFSRV